ncbi:photosystem I assembly protein Ycf3 [bacterium BMS3Bbin14]|nr:photosystem I assembly protein Ycf3 [bacterium BMS3Abin13]GBE52400.1 photosystem I assembly protein Ycf3 [bacterium BMS3Bbin14]HDO29975.1 tetratricopeptide repeat protein [Desulfobacteraceae bacterium]
MSMPENYIKKQTFLIGLAVSLIIGFLGGVAFSVYKSPDSVPVAQSPPPLPQNQSAGNIASLEHATGEHPDNVEAWIQLGHAYFDSNQPAKAIYAYNKSLELSPDSPAVLTDLGVMYRRNNQPRQAIAVFDRALRINPRFEPALFNKGVVLLNDLKETGNAIRSWQQLLKINPLAAGPNGEPVSKMISSLAARSRK